MIIGSSTDVLDPRLIIRILTGQRLHERGFLDLGPAELTGFQFFFGVDEPPETVFEKRSDHDCTITFSNKVPIRDIRRW